VSHPHPQPLSPCIKREQARPRARGVLVPLASLKDLPLSCFAACPALRRWGEEVGGEGASRRRHVLTTLSAHERPGARGRRSRRCWREYPRAGPNLAYLSAVHEKEGP